jgi:hypothetical protein
MCHDTMSHLVDHPEIRPYFFDDEIGVLPADDAREKSRREARANDLKQKAANLKAQDPAGYQRVMAFTDKLADFLDYCFVLESVHPPHDFLQWWQWCCDVYDQSPILQDYFKQHRDWYSVTPSLTDPEERRKMFDRIEKVVDETQPRAPSKLRHRT